MSHDPGEIALRKEANMAEIIVLGFKDQVTADEAIPEVQAMQSEGLIELADWARAETCQWRGYRGPGPPRCRPT